MMATLEDSRYEIVAQQIISPDARFDSNAFFIASMFHLFI